MQRIDGYQIFAELKRGAGSTIYKAWDIQYSRTVLIKLLRAAAGAEPAWRAQFLKEGKISARLAHPNLRRIFQSGMLGDEPFLILEYVEGPTLFELIRQNKKLPIDICLFIAKELAKGIAVVHQNKVLHRDIKPQNVFIAFAGAVKLGDLGLAHDRNESTRSIAGTPAYMSPEQVLGREVTETSDLFSFGAVLYEMLTGEPAFADRTLPATLHHVVNWDPVPIVLLHPEVPGELVAACQKLLAKNPVERFRNAEAVVESLTRLERRYNIGATPKHLAEFLETPQSYRRVTMEQSAAVESGAEIKRYKTPSLSWGVTAVVGATMFLAGVMFIKILKDRVDERSALAKNGVAAAPLHVAPGHGHLDLKTTPQSVVRVDDDSLGIAPLTAPIKMAAGQHRIQVQHARWGEKTIYLIISAEDTLRQTIDLTKP